MITIRQECINAKEKGLTTFESSKPCKKGHTLRNSRNGVCHICNGVWQNDYRIKNLGKAAAYSKKYRDMHKKKMREYIAEYMRKYRATKNGQERLKNARKTYSAKKKSSKHKD